MNQNLDNLVEKIFTDRKTASMAAIVMANSLKSFIKVVHFYKNSGSEFSFKDFNLLIIKKLEDIAKGRNKKRNLAISLPVGSGKSLIIEYFIAWSFCRNINNTYLYTSHSSDNIIKLSREIKEIIECDLIQSIYGISLKKDERSKINWSFENSINRTGLMAKPIGAGLTGVDAGNPNVEGYSGALICDDLMDAADIRRQVVLNDVIETFDSKLCTRRRTPTTPAIVIMQRLCNDDLIGWLKSKQSSDWEFLEVKALRADGESFWEERFPKSELLKIKDINRSKFMAQYQQMPIDNEDISLFKIKKFQYYDNLPDDITIYQSWDTAVSEKKTADCSVCTTWGVQKTKFGNKYYLIDVFKDRIHYEKLKEKIIDLQNKYNPLLILIEKKSSGDIAAEHLIRQGNGRIRGIVPTTDKVSRAAEPASIVNSGIVYLPSRAVWLNDFIDEISIFPRQASGVHDDQVDSMTQFLNFIESKTKDNLMLYSC